MASTFTSLDVRALSSHSAHFDIPRWLSISEIPEKFFNDDELASTMKPLRPSPEKCEEIVVNAFLTARNYLDQENVDIEFIEYLDKEENDYGQTIHPFNIRYHIDTDPAPVISETGTDTGSIEGGIYLEMTGMRTDEQDVATVVIFDTIVDSDDDFGTPYMRPQSDERELFSFRD